MKNKQNIFEVSFKEAKISILKKYCTKGSLYPS